MDFIHTIPNPEHRLMVAIGLCCGMRVGEIIELQHRDIATETITVRKTKCRTDANGNKKVPYRNIPMPGWLQEMCRDVLPKIKRTNNPASPVFTCERTGLKLKEGGANKRLRTIFGNFDVGDQIPTFHMLRITAATHLYNECGHDLGIPQTFLGHASVATTAIYVRRDRTVFENHYKSAFG